MYDFVAAKGIWLAIVNFAQIVCTPIILHVFWKKHKNEFKKHGCGFIFYFISIILFTLEEISEYVYLDSKIQRSMGEYKSKHRLKLSHTAIAWKQIGVHHLLLPIVVLFFKSHCDIVMAVSKLNDLAMVSAVLQYRTSVVSTSNETSTMSFKESSFIRK